MEEFHHLEVMFQKYMILVKQKRISNVLIVIILHIIKAILKTILKGFM